MVGDGTAAIAVTFILAMAGYAGLTTVLLLSVFRRPPALLMRLVAGIILVHVFMVWAFRYGWDPALAVRNGYAGFVVFHVALGCVLAAAAAPPRAAGVLIRISFLIVTMGSLGAVFRYETVALYRIPVITCAVAGIGGLILGEIRRRRSRTASA